MRRSVLRQQMITRYTEKEPSQCGVLISRGEWMLKNKMKKILCGVAICVTVCSQVIFPQAVFAATKKAVEKAGEEFVAAMEADADESAEVSSENVDTDVSAEESVDNSETEEEAQSGPTEEELRAQIVDFALQFEGNPYVYGGTSLTNGADCSGFVMSVFAQFGYSLPRVAADQYYQSVQKSVADLEPGDLVFYGSGISHVALYIGDGQIIHASTSASGIKISNYDYETPVGVGTYIESDGFYGE
ncbi:MAG TPA: cell wall hydrolase [Blautia sp.]|nr:cell wall hydrolase [Blautia sp.]